MNWKFWNRRYYLASIYTLVVAIILITYWKSFTHTSEITLRPLIVPFAVGLSLAYILNFILRLYEKKIKRRWISLSLVYLTVLAIILAFFLLIAPHISSAMGHFINEFPDFSEQIITQLDNRLMQAGLSDEHVQSAVGGMDKMIERFVTFNQNIVAMLLKHLLVIGETLVHIILGLFLSAYILAKKELIKRQFSQVTLAILGIKKNEVLKFWLRRTNVIFGRFFKGMIINSIIVGIITIPLLFLFKIPFAVLIGFIVATTNMIPVFGPLIGAIPSAIMIFFISPTKAMVFTILILIIQQIDANIITPKILGDKIGIAPIWVLISILIFGHFFGVIGMIIGVPTTAILIEITREITTNKIKKMNKTTQTNP